MSCTSRSGDLGRRRLLAWAMAGASAAMLATLPAARAWAGDPVHVPEPPPGKALIVFYRKLVYPGMAVSYIVREGKTQIGELGAGTYFIAAVDPGLHTYTVHAERHSDMQITVEEGEIYYVRFELDVGVILYQPTLTPSEQWKFDQLSSQLRLSPPLRPTATDLPPAS